MFADKFGSLVGVMSQKDVQKICVPVFKVLCQDAEAEIRASIAFSMDKLLCGCPEEAKKEVAISGCKLMSDTISHVRVSLASTLFRASAFVPKDVWGSTLMPTITTLLHDTDADVRLAVVSGFSSATGPNEEVRSIAMAVVPVVVALSSDDKWRVREVVLRQVPSIVTTLGKSAEDMLELCIKALTDRVAVIRNGACESCLRLVQQEGTPWACTKLLPRVSPMREATNYLHRVTFLQLLSAVMAALDSNAVRNELLPVLVSMSSDRVANVRVNVVKCLRKAVELQKLSKPEIDVILSRLAHDTDVDVRECVKGNPKRI